MLEYICDRVIPGCTHEERGDTPERVAEKAREHLHQHHGMDYLDGDQTQQVNTAIISVR